MTVPSQVNGLTPILYASDFRATMAYFTDKLGFLKAWDWGDPPGFGCVTRGAAEVFICQGGQGGPGTWLSVFVSDVDAIYEEFKNRGAKIPGPPVDQPWGMREFLAELPDGHTLRFGQSKPAKDFKIRREAVEVRLEERLAAVLKDLAARTNRNVGEVLEETLLHTFEPFPGPGEPNVPSPHSKETFRLIADLKKKHGLDYDVHANYRFTE